MVASVTLEALQRVKAALITFSNDICGMPFRAAGRAEIIRTECEGQIKQTEQKVKELSENITQLRAEISRLEEQISGLERGIFDLGMQISNLEGRISDLEEQISNLGRKIGALEKRISEEGLCASETNLGHLELKLQISSSELDTQRGEVHLIELRQSALRSQKRQAESQKRQAEEELYEQERQRKWYQDKLGRLKDAYSRVRLDLDAYVGAFRHFEATSGNDAVRYVSAVNECIKNIDEYLSVNL